jgi:hypothetical protein
MKKFIGLIVAVFLFHTYYSQSNDKLYTSQFINTSPIDSFLPNSSSVELLEFSSLLKQKKDTVLTLSRFIPNYLFYDLTEKNIISNQFKIEYLKRFTGKSEIFDIDADSSEYVISSLGKFFLSDIVDAYIFQIKGFSCGTGYKLFLVTYDKTSNKFIQETCVYSVEICGSSEFIKKGAFYDINNDNQNELIVSSCLISLSELTGINVNLEIYSFDKNEFKKIQITDTLKTQIISKRILPCNYE